MTRSHRTRRIHADSAALARVMEIAREADVYNSRPEARKDDYQTILNLLCDEFEKGGGES